MRLRLVVPVDIAEPTGGNVYDLAVANALRAAGEDVELVQSAPSELFAALRRPASGPTLVDGLLACQNPEAVAASRVGVLMHMPLPLQQGLPPQRVADLQRMEAKALTAAAVVIATSEWTADYLAERYSLRRLEVAAPGVDPAPVGEGSDPPLIVHVAALLPHKDQLCVVEALSNLRDLPWQARFVGSMKRDEAYAAAVRDAVTRTSLTTRVDFTGVLRRDDAWGGADLALLPSLVEAYGMVVTEALARGIPAIVAEGGAVEALGLTENGARPGAVIRPGDSAMLATVLRRWLTHSGYASQLRAAALSRRATLTGWDVTAAHVRRALTNR